MNEKYISATQARREFLALLKDVRQGQIYIITRYGKPVARVRPAGHRAGPMRKRTALSAARSPDLEILDD